jgi:hypothetical protein
MRTDLKDPNAPDAPVVKKSSSGGGCFSVVFLLTGVVTLFIAVTGYILGLFNMVLKVSGSKLPKIDLPLLLIFLGFGSVCLGAGWLIGKLEDRISKKKNKN